MATVFNKDDSRREARDFLTGSIKRQNALWGKDLTERECRKLANERAELVDKKKDRKIKESYNHVK